MFIECGAQEEGERKSRERERTKLHIYLQQAARNSNAFNNVFTLLSVQTSRSAGGCLTFVNNNL